MAESVDLEQKVAELETRVKKLEIAALVIIIIVFALYIFAKI